MRDHPEIANGFTKGKKVEYDALWDRLTAELNKNGPPKECSDWKKVKSEHYKKLVSCTVITPCLAYFSHG